MWIQCVLFLWLIFKNHFHQLPQVARLCLVPQIIYIEPMSSHTMLPAFKSHYLGLSL